MSDWTTIDFFSDESLVEDPYPYFDKLRSQCPVLPLPHLGVVAVTGYDEAHRGLPRHRDVLVVQLGGRPVRQFPVPLEGDDVGDIVDRYRDQLPMHEHMVTMDPPEHTQERALLMRLITPKRLKDNEDVHVAAGRPAARRVRGRRGSASSSRAFAQPFAMLVVADLLGVPEEDHQRFRECFGLSASLGQVGAGERATTSARTRWPWLDEWFAAYIEDRRRKPRQDVLTQLALATYPDGAIPDVTSVVRTATFLFAAGQETTARLLAVGAQAPRRAPRAAGPAAGGQRPHPGLHRGGPAHREPGEGRLPPGPPRPRRSAASTSRPAPR